MPPRMDPHLDHEQLSVFYLTAVTMMYSTVINPRLLESSSHALWNGVMLELSKASPGQLFVGPQEHIYVSPKDKPTVDDSIRTTGDKKAVGVVPDFTISLPFFDVDRTKGPEAGVERKGPISSPSQKLPTLDPLQIRQFFPEWTRQEWNKHRAMAKLNHLMFSILGELKRPITRHPLDIFRYIHCIMGRIKAGRAQVEQQAFCMFCSIKFTKQDQTILIAGGGEYFSYMKVERSSYNREDQALWNYQEYIDCFISKRKARPVIPFLGPVLDLLDEDVESSDEEEDPVQLLVDDDELDAVIEDKDQDEDYEEAELRDAIAAGAAEDALAELVQEHQRQQLEYSAEAKQLSHTTKNEIDQLTREMRIASAGRNSFTDIELENAYRLLCQAPGWFEENGPCKFLFVSPGTDFSLPVGQWSPITRLGSPAGEVFLDDIWESLKRAGRQEAMF